MRRRQFIQSATATGIAVALGNRTAIAGKTPGLIKKAIPSSGETICTVGMGTSRTFNNSVPREQLLAVTRALFDNGGQVIDSSPMYGPAEELVGELLPSISNKRDLFAATKVWTDGRGAGIRQMQESMRLMGVKRMDLMQIHNLRDWQTHLPLLREWKAEGIIRYLGITTSHGRSHAELEQIMRRETLDFIQLTYNIEEQETADRLLPLAADRGMATLINRPYARGNLFGTVRNTPLPDWAAEIDCDSWGQFFLKYILGLPAATCVIPATTKEKHMLDNMAAARGRLPDSAMRREMLRYYQSL